MGGLPSGSIILFLGEADTGMTTCVQQIMYRGLLDGRPAVYFTTGRSWEDIVAEMNLYGWSLERFFDSRKMWFIDSLSDVIRSAPFPAVEQTLKALQTHVRETSGLYLLLANKGVHNEHVENTVKHLSDGVVDLSTEPFGSEDYARKMRVLKMPGAFTDMKVYAYRVGSAGIEMAALHRVR